MRCESRQPDFASYSNELTPCQTVADHAWVHGECARALRRGRPPPLGMWAENRIKLVRATTNLVGYRRPWSPPWKDGRTNGPG
jgi:hypothetical protein